MIPWYVFVVRIEHDVGRPLIPLTVLVGRHRAPRRLPGLTVHARAWRAVGYGRRSDGCALIVGDWASGNPALAISRGSCGTPPWTPPDGHRFPDMLWSPSGFRLRVSQATQEPPSEFIPTASGIQRSASRRTPCMRFSRRRLTDVLHRRHSTFQARKGLGGTTIPSRLIRPR